ncbi:Ubiquitin carboxyl-terminal hydrolase 15 [Acorus gramineus]|uniref:Ubiquitin carboxyl-terminal hydrolase 15 n=1 Tax=Acorus gramineus TaxID=55184 RepID=A0AAV9A3Q4_ACOGR|nr:Ubiquitin carboxyl-terminal hydrolase 15 [Acorus gramineus]
MLEPREADLPALFLVFVVLPLVTYILLGICNEATKKKERVSMLAQMAAEEAFRAEASSTARIIPLVPPPKPRIFECARCFAPATTRCSRCKSVRYCSGKCQIIHWRQGHKQECQEADAAISNLSANLASSESAYRRGQLDEKFQALFPYEDLVKFFQCEIWDFSPRGLLNCGNSCYANAVLQCLMSTKPLSIYLQRRLHSRTCGVRGWCLLCELEQHVTMLLEGGGPLSPSRLLSNMRNIGCRMGGGNQEDAHEFLRLLLMSMQTICLEGLGGENQVDSRVQETTLIQQIFGGRLRSKVKCLRCHHESECYENIMDLTLEILDWVESLEDALAQFTAAEDLDGENMYRCGRCATYVRARKQLSVHEAPNILTIVLKRFQVMLLSYCNLLSLVKLIFPHGFIILCFLLICFLMDDT